MAIILLFIAVLGAGVIGTRAVEGNSGPAIHKSDLPTTPAPQRG